MTRGFLGSGRGPANQNREISTILHVCLGLAEMSFLYIQHHLRKLLFVKRHCSMTYVRFSDSFLQNSGMDRCGINETNMLNHTKATGKDTGYKEKNLFP